MISKRTAAAIENSSAIRAMFVEGREMAQKYGAENVYDFSLGNPATPAPAAIHGAIRSLLDESEAASGGTLALHGYMPNGGFSDVRAAIAENLNGRFGTAFGAEDVLMTVGAAGGINAVLKAILDPGDEVIVISPYFGEYREYVSNFGGVLVEARSNRETFQPDFADFEGRITPKTRAVIVNTPNNPTGVVYTPETMRELARILEKKEAQFGTDVYLISDEPYRELVYDGREPDFLTKYYDNTIVVYSFSKSLSLPGERIGYVAVPKEARDAADLVRGIEISIRTLGYVNAPSLMQKAVARCLGEKADVAFYDENRSALYGELTRMGFSCVRPDGAFYLWVKSPVPDEKEFVDAGKRLHILMVGGSSFGCPGFVRIAYCVSHETVKNSLPAFERLAEEFGLKGGK